MDCPVQLCQVTSDVCCVRSALEDTAATTATARNKWLTMTVGFDKSPLTLSIYRIVSALSPPLATQYTILSACLSLSLYMSACLSVYFTLSLSLLLSLISPRIALSVLLKFGVFFLIRLPVSLCLSLSFSLPNFINTCNSCFFFYFTHSHLRKAGYTNRLVYYLWYFFRFIIINLSSE